MCFFIPTSQSEAKMKEELEDNVKGNKEAINNLYQHFTERIDEIKGVNASQSGDLVNWNTLSFLIR